MCTQNRGSVLALCKIEGKIFHLPQVVLSYYVLFSGSAIFAFERSFTMILEIMNSIPLGEQKPQLLRDR